MAADQYPYAKPWKDRHGQVRWRFRRGDKVVYLRGEPGEPQFDASYEAAIAGRAPLKARVVPIPTSAEPRSFKAAWRIYRATSSEWKSCTDETRLKQTAIAEEFLSEAVSVGAPSRWGDMPIADLRRRHIKAILASMSDRPFAAKHRLNIIRKMILAALDEEWIEVDPSYGIKYRPATIKGWRPWTWDELQQFEKKWPIGSTARLCYALALWLGPRRGDISRLKPSDIIGDTITIDVSKTGVTVTGVITPELRDVLVATDMTGPRLVMTQQGKPISAKALTTRMARWTDAAGLPAGCTLHGLRKTLGTFIAEAGGSTRQSMAALGHKSLSQAQLYSDHADRASMTRDAMDKVVSMVEARRKKAG